MQTINNFSIIFGNKTDSRFGESVNNTSNPAQVLQWLYAMKPTERAKMVEQLKITPERLQNLIEKVSYESFEATLSSISKKIDNIGNIKINPESGITIDEINFASSKLLEKGGRVTNFNLKDLLKGCSLKNFNNLIACTEEAKFLLVSNGIDTLLSELDEEDNSEDAMKLRTKDFYQELMELKKERKHKLLMKQLEKNFELKKINNSLPKCGPRSYKDTHHTKQEVPEPKNLYFKDFYTSEAFDENDVENVLIDDDLYVGAIRSLIPSLFPGESCQKFCELYALGNYDSNTKHPNKGYQGDTKGKMVIGINPGKTATMCFQWFLREKAIGQNLRVSIPTGSLYMMSEKATGHDWKKSNILTLRHCLVDKNSDSIIPECQKWNRFHMNLRTRI